MPDCQRVFFANVDHTFFCTGSIGTNDHPFDDTMRIAFEDAAVHIGTRIPLVGITYEELGAFSFLSGQQFPFQSRREAAAAPAPQTGLFDLVDNHGRAAFGKYFRQHRISAGLNVIIDTDRIDFLIPGQEPADLSVKKRYIILLFHGMTGFRIPEKQIFKHLVMSHGLDNTPHLSKTNPWVKHPARFDEHRGLHLAKTVTPGDAETNLLSQALRQNLTFGHTDKVPSPAGLPACARGNNDTVFVFVIGIR